MDDQQVALQQLLARNPLFSSVTADEAAYLLAVGRRRTVPARQALFEVGSPGSELFVVLEGDVHVLMPSQDGDVLVERFRRGDILGEIAVLDDQPRTATGVAATPTEVLAIERADVHAFLERFPRYRDILIGILIKRLRRTSSLVSEMLTVESGVILPPEQPAAPRFQATIVGYGRYGNSYIGPKYAKRGYPWEVAAIVDPLLTPGRFAASVLGRSRPDIPLFHGFEQWRDEYFARLAPERRARQVVEIPLKPDLVYEQVLKYVDAGVAQLILPKPVVMSQAQLSDLIERVERGRLKAAVASQWHYSDFPRLLEREIRQLAAERGAVRRVEIEFSKENGLAYATPPPLLELPHALQLLGSIGLVDFERDAPRVDGTETLVTLAYHPPKIAEGVHICAGTDYRPPAERKRLYPGWDYQEPTLKIYFDDGSDAPGLAVDFWIKFIRSGDIAIRPGLLRIRGAGHTASRYLELNFVDDQLLRMNRAIYTAFDQPFEQFQADPAVLSLARYRPIGEQLMAIQAAWEERTTNAER